MTVECSVEAYPAPAIDWRHDKKPLIPGQGVVLSYDGECATLKFAQCKPEHTGRYTCIAQNCAGM